MPQLHIAPLQPEEVEAALALDRAVLGGLWQRGGYEREIESDASDLLALRLDRELIGIGCLWAILEEAHITTLAIAPNWQRRGLGRWLLLHLLAAAQTRGLEWATLEVRASNEAAIALYHQLGFSDVGRRKRYYHNPEEDALILWLKQLPSDAVREQLREARDRTWEHLRLQGFDTI